MNWLTHNWRLKLAALVLGATTWWFVSNITNDRRVLQAVPVEVRTRDNVIVLEQSTSLADVEVRGTRNDVRQIQRDDLLVVADLTRETRRGEVSCRLGPSNVRHPRWIQPVAVNPGRMVVVLDDLVTRDLPVHVPVEGQPAPGYRLERIAVFPEKIPVRGPRTRLEENPRLTTTAISLHNRRASFRERVELTLDPLTDLPLPRRWVEVEIQIRPSTAEEFTP